MTAALGSVVEPDGIETELTPDSARQPMERLGVALFYGHDRMDHQTPLSGRPAGCYEVCAAHASHVHDLSRRISVKMPIAICKTVQGGGGRLHDENAHVTPPFLGFCDLP